MLREAGKGQIAKEQHMGGLLWGVLACGTCGFKQIVQFKMIVSLLFQVVDPADQPLLLQHPFFLLSQPSFL